MYKERQVTDRCENTRNGITQDWFQHSHLIHIELSVGTAAKQASKETETQISVRRPPSERSNIKENLKKHIWKVLRYGQCVCVKVKAITWRSADKLTKDRHQPLKKAKK